MARAVGLRPAIARGFFFPEGRATTLNNTYDDAFAAKRASESTENQLAQLRKQYADLAGKMVEGEPTLAGAQASNGKSC